MKKAMIVFMAICMTLTSISIGNALPASFMTNALPPTQENNKIGIRVYQTEKKNILEVGTIDYKGEVRIIIYNVTGQRIYQKDYEAKTESYTYTDDITGLLSKGIYIVQVILLGSNDEKTKKIVVTETSITTPD